MPIATHDQYCQMLDAAKEGRFAFPAINVTSLETLNATLAGFSEAKSDGIIQVSSGGELVGGLREDDGPEGHVAERPRGVLPAA